MLLLSLCLLSLGSCPGSARTVMEALSTRFDLITFTNFLRAAHLDKVLDSGEHMVLVPTDKAFGRLPDSYMNMLHGTNTQLLPDFLKYHIVSFTGQLTTYWTGEKVNTLLGKALRIVTYDHVNKTVVDGVVMKDANLTAANGHIYLLDETLSPPSHDIYTSLVRDDRFSTFLTAVSLAGMRDSLKDDKITVLAPTNEAFNHMDSNKRNVLFNNHVDLQEFVRFHILHDIYFSKGMSEDVLINVTAVHNYHFKIHFRAYGTSNVRVYPGNIAVAQSDWLATNGVMHVLERVILPLQRCFNWL